MKNTITIRENKLKLNGVGELTFDEDIYEVIDMEEVVIVLTMPRDGVMTVNRIYGVIDGKIAWRVQDILEFNPDYIEAMTKLHALLNVYSGIDVYKKNPELIIATTFGGFRFLINPNNGKIVGTESWVR